MRRGVGCRGGSDPELLWLWCRLAAVASIQLLAWELPYAVGLALKRPKKKKGMEIMKLRPKNMKKMPVGRQVLKEGAAGKLLLSSGRRRCSQAEVVESGESGDTRGPRQSQILLSAVFPACLISENLVRQTRTTDSLTTPWPPLPLCLCCHLRTERDT